MILYSRVTEQADNEPVTLSEAKTHLEVYSDSKDGYITTLITAARRICEGYAGLSFVTQERSIKLDRFPANYYLYLPYGPVQAVLSFTYTDSDDNVVTLIEGTDFNVDVHNYVSRVFPIDTDGNITSWPTDYKSVLEGIEVVYQAGYDSVSGEMLPSQAKIAVLRVVAKMFENRGDDSGSNRYMGNGILDWDTQTILDTIKVTWNANLD